MAVTTFNIAVARFNVSVICFEVAVASFEMAVTNSNLAAMCFYVAVSYCDFSDVNIAVTPVRSTKKQGNLNNYPVCLADRTS